MSIMQYNIWHANQYLDYTIGIACSVRLNASMDAWVLEHLLSESEIRRETSSHKSISK